MTRPALASRYGPWALVAGGSEGIGAAFADRIARRGIHLVIVARRPGPLEETAARLRRERAVQVRTVAADLADPAGVRQVIEAAADVEIGLVVANAAVIPTGPFLATPAADVGRAVDLNCRASALLARTFAPAMADRRRGGLVFVSSLAGMQGVPGLAAYSATKSFLITLGESLWAELRHSGVDVITVCAGAVGGSSDGPAGGVTGRDGTASAGAGPRARQAPGTSTPDQVAAAALGSLGRGFRVVPGGLNRVSAVTLQHLLPRRAAIAIVGRASAAAVR